MITSRSKQTPEAVARHYDELDPFYRDIWGSHVHHGYWRTGRETSAEAAEGLAELVADRMGLTAGMRVCDIGCGYGETARFFASRYAAAVEGVTVSERQYQIAQASTAPGVQIFHRDWLRNDFPGAYFDGAYAIESSEHIAEKAKFFEEAYRVLRPGGRLVVCAWLANSHAPAWQRRLLLEPICDQGRMPGMGTEEDYLDLARAQGFDRISIDDISANVRRTWAICLNRLVSKIVTDRRYGAFLFARGAQNRVFAVTVPLILAAYRVGAMRYCVFVFGKPPATAVRQLKNDAHA
jgi:tocopherol O-methyltransferase